MHRSAKQMPIPQVFIALTAIFADAKTPPHSKPVAGYRPAALGLASDASRLRSMRTLLAFGSWLEEDR